MNTYAQVVESGNFVTGSVCIDCLMWIANGDDSGASEEWDHAAADATLAAYDVTLGHFHHGQFDTRCWHFGRDCDDVPDCYQECEQTTFATTSCSVCNSPLAGSRNDVVMIERSAL